MPRLVHSIPQYSKHRASGQAVVTIAKEDHYYLGPYSTEASHLEYDTIAAMSPARVVSNHG